MAKTTTAVASDDHSDDRCENCGACKHCGHGGAQMVPQIIPMPYPVTPVTPVTPWGRPWSQPYITCDGSSLGASSSSGVYTQTWNG